MQPIVGALSDKCTSRWGRRRPFLVGGSVIVILNLATIGWTRDIVGLVIDRNDETKVRALIYKMISPLYWSLTHPTYSTSMEQSALQ
jgi:solute carrier family 45 protein 1/2/4